VYFQSPGDGITKDFKIVSKYGPFYVARSSVNASVGNDVLIRRTTKKLSSPTQEM
jgi:hypothetical protein